MRNITKIIAIAAFFASGTAHAGTPQWKLTESSGTVNILRAGVSKIALNGGSLKAGDVIATGKKSRAVLVRGQEYVVVSPNSRLRISAPKQTGGVVQFFEELGNVLFRIDKKATPHFGVKTPYMAAVVKGTTFSVTVSETGTAVQVTEGAVQVSTLDGGATQLLSPGMIGVVNRDQQFRLSITGAESRTIDSPNAPAGSDATPEPINEEALVEIANSSFEGTISAPVMETPVSLSDITGGLISNAQSSKVPATQIASNERAVPEFVRNNLSNPVNGGKGKGNPSNGNGIESGKGVGNGNDGGNGNGVGNGNDGGNGNGVGNGNDGGNGNGVGNGNDGGNGNGVGNGNDGGNGNGVGNGNDGGNGNGVGNGNDGGNGNGVGNGNDGGNGNGVGNGNDGGNGNGVGNGNDGGNGNGVGNGNDGGNGNGVGNGNDGGNGNGVGNGNDGGNGNGVGNGNDGGNGNGVGNGNDGGNGNGVGNGNDGGNGNGVGNGNGGSNGNGGGKDK